MEEKNAKTGKLRDDYYAEPLSSELYKTPSGKVVPTMYPQTEPMNTGTEPTQETQTKDDFIRKRTRRNNSAWKW